MKKVLLFLAILLMGQSAFAQINDIYINDGVVLSGNQWHFDNYSVMEANNGNYLVVNPYGYTYQYLPPFVPADFEARYRERVYSFQPYIYNNCLGWYVNCSVNRYFYYPNGALVRLSYVPVFHQVYYTLKHLRHINLRNWHWHRPGYNYYNPRPPQHNYRPPQQHRPNGNVTPPPQQHRPNGNVTPHPQQNKPNGNVSRPPQQQRPGGNVSAPPQQHRPNGNVSRPSENRSSSQRANPPQNSGRSSSSSSSRSSHSQHRR